MISKFLMRSTMRTKQIDSMFKNTCALSHKKKTISESRMIAQRLNLMYIFDNGFELQIKPSHFRRLITNKTKR